MAATAAATRGLAAADLAARAPAAPPPPTDSEPEAAGEAAAMRGDGVALDSDRLAKGSALAEAEAFLCVAEEEEEE